MPSRNGPQPWRPRAGRPKSRTGCSTCKIRRIKCDETKPSCLKCTSTGRNCDGYSAAHKPPGNGGRNIQLALRPSSIPKALTRTVMHNDQEYRAFLFFRSQTAPQLSSALQSGLWDSLILQISHSIPAVRHAVIAIGSLGERLNINNILTLENHEANKRHDFACFQYQKAIRELRRQLSNEIEQTVESALICCFLFICFEFLQGNDTGVLTHLKSGLDIILHSQVKPIKIKSICYYSRCSDRGDFLSNSAQLFGLLDSTAALWIGERSLQHSIVEDYETYIPVPNMFSNLQEARCSINRLIDQVTYLQESINVLEGLQAAKMKQEYLTSQFEIWLLRFQSLLERLHKDLTAEDMYHITRMRMNFNTTLMELAATSEVEEETVYGRYDSTFEEIVSYSTTLLQPINALHSTKLFPGNLFQFDDGPIQSLYFTAIKCCNREICWKAISLLLNAPWREGARESTSMAKIATRKVRKREEQGVYHR